MQTEKNLLNEVFSKEYCYHIYQVKALINTFLLNIVSHSAVFRCDLPGPNRFERKEVGAVAAFNPWMYSNLKLGKAIWTWEKNVKVVKTIKMWGKQLKFGESNLNVGKAIIKWAKQLRSEQSSCEVSKSIWKCANQFKSEQSNKFELINSIWKLPIH